METYDFEQAKNFEDWVRHSENYGALLRKHREYMQIELELHKCAEQFRATAARFDFTVTGEQILAASANEYNMLMAYPQNKKILDDYLYGITADLAGYELIGPNSFQGGLDNADAIKHHGTKVLHFAHTTARHVIEYGSLDALTSLLAEVLPAGEWLIRCEPSSEQNTTAVIERMLTIS